VKLRDAMKALEARGTNQNRKIYRRHGAVGDLFGVSFKHLDELAREIGVDHALAGALWRTGNADARVLAMKIADATSLSAREADDWVKDLDYYVVADSFAPLVARSPHALKQLAKWCTSKKEWVGRAGYQVLCHTAMQPAAALSDAELAGHLPRIEAEIHDAANRKRSAMNDAVIAIGMRSDALEKQALASARRIGTVLVDHGDTACKTPEALTYLPKARAHARKKAAKKATKKTKR